MEISGIPKVQPLAFQPALSQYSSEALAPVTCFPMAFPPVWQITSSQPTGHYEKTPAPPVPNDYSQSCLTDTS